MSKMEQTWLFIRLEKKTVTEETGSIGSQQWMTESHQYSMVVDREPDASQIRMPPLTLTRMIPDKLFCRPAESLKGTCRG